jgi:hypothetical protein
MSLSIKTNKIKLKFKATKNFFLQTTKQLGFICNSSPITSRFFSLACNNNRDFALGCTDKKLAPQWVTGISDSEGNFSIFSQKTKNGYKFTVAYKVTQKNHSGGILYDLQRYFECGNINLDNRGEDALKFNVTKLDDIISKVIAHFDKYPLLTSKNLDYQDFRRVAYMMRDGLHLNEGGMAEILAIKENMNSKRSFEERWNYLDKTEPIVLNNEWVQAFIDGEGSFQFRIADAVSRGKPYVALSPTLEISQSNHDIKLLRAFVNFFQQGYLKPKYDIDSLEAAKSSRIVNRYVVNQHAVVTKFLDDYPMLTRKHLDYLDWKRLIQLKAERAQDTVEGRKMMEEIKASMNKGR